MRLAVVLFLWHTAVLPTCWFSCIPCDGAREWILVAFIGTVCILAHRTSTVAAAPSVSSTVVFGRRLSIEIICPSRCSSSTCLETGQDMVFFTRWDDAQLLHQYIHESNLTKQLLEGTTFLVRLVPFSCDQMMKMAICSHNGRRTETEFVDDYTLKALVDDLDGRLDLGVLSGTVLAYTASDLLNYS